MTLVDGRELAVAIRAEVSAAATGVAPTLAAVSASADPACAWYLRSIVHAASAVGIATHEVACDPEPSALLAALDAASAEDGVDAIICLTPLPAGLTLAEAGEHIALAKDVDGANPHSLGRLAAGLPAFAPATAQAAVELVRSTGLALAGSEVVVVGRSNVVGKPAALLLLAEHATVTVCHSRTRDLARVTARADVLVAAVGQARLLGRDHVKPGALVIDVGTNEGPDGGIVGDVDTAAVEGIAAVTPVPGGVGPVTTAVLLRHVVEAARGQRSP